MPRSGTVARQLIREPSSCPTLQAAISSSLAWGGVGGMEGTGPGAKAHSQVEAMRSEFVGSRMLRGVSCWVGWKGRQSGEKDGRTRTASREDRGVVGLLAGGETQIPYPEQGNGVESQVEKRGPTSHGFIHCGGQAPTLPWVSAALGSGVFVWEGIRRSWGNTL